MAAPDAAWEAGLPTEPGFAPPPDRCAATGARKDLRRVPPSLGFLANAGEPGPAGRIAAADS